ncbi:MAG: LytTR family DNA-binding domain-containing protein [Sphingorhabdus sp.]
MTLHGFLDYWCSLDWRHQLRHLAQYMLIALLLVLVVPFGMFPDQPFVRLSYWFAVLAIFGMAMMPMTARIIRSTRAFDDFSRWSGIFGCVLFATIPMTFIVHAIEYWGWSIAMSRLGNGDDRPQFSRDVAGMMLLFSQLMSINLFAIGVNSFFIIALHGLQPDAKRSTAAGIRFLSRLPDHLGTKLLYLQMEDHYLRATTVNGTALILIRFRDALQELDNYDGLQVHRSWWVARDAVTKLSKQGRKLELLMVDGSVIPVSAAYRKQVEEAVLGAMPA